MTAATTLVELAACPAHELPLYPNRDSAEQEVVRRRSRGVRGGTQGQFVVRPCGRGFHVARAPRDAREAARLAARDLVAELKALDPSSVDAGVVPGTPSCLDACEHKSGCPAPAAVLVRMDDPLDGRPIVWQGCYRHAESWVRWLLEDPHRRDHAEPPSIDVEVQVAS